MNSLQLRSNADRFSMKVRRLSPEDMERYREKIVKVGGVDPYTMDCQEDVLPLTVDYDRIFCYLITNLSFRSGLPNRNNKSLEAFKAFQSGFVKAVHGCQYEDVYVVQGKVLHSMNLSDPPAECWVIINNSCDVDDVDDVGSIESAHCDCIAGAGETCSHVAATLYALSYAREICLGGRLSVTELPAYWMQPGGSGADENLYATVDSICFGRKLETECALRDVNLDKTDKDYQELIQSIINSGHTVAASRAFFRELNDDEDTELILRRSQLEKLSFKHFFDEQNTTKTLNELIGMVDQVNWQISEDDQNLIEQNTRDQAANILWFQLRYGRITASIFARCVKTRKQTPSKSLFSAIFGENVFQNIPATIHGKRCEHKGVAEAVKYFRSQNHRNVIDRRCGLIVSDKFPFFAASPDHLLSCGCCGTVVVEVKCPFKFDTLTQEEGLNVLLNRPQPYLIKLPDNTIVLNQCHQYYFQVQMQIFMARAAYGLFAIWAPRFSIFLKIEENEEFWAVNSEKATLFFKNVLSPEILGHYFTLK